MITSEITSNIVNSPTSGTQFNLQADSYLFDLLTSKIYSDPMAAAIREISTNAYDACIEAGARPSIEVHLPVVNEAYFSVRDYGTGMSPDTISTLYSTVGASSKRTSNYYNGCMG